MEPDNLLLLEAWARDGLTRAEIAHNVGCSTETLRVWCKEHPAISAAIKKGREVTDIIIENALYKSAQTQVITIRKPIKVKTVKQDGRKKIEEERIEYAEEQVVVPANVTAQIYWLKNRRPDKWRDRPLDGDADNGIDKLDKILEGITNAAKS